MVHIVSFPSRAMRALRMKVRRFDRASASLRRRKPTVRGHVDRSYQRMHREIPTRVGPGRHSSPGGAARQRAEALESVLIAVLGVNALAGAKLDDAPRDMHLLAGLADKM